MAKNRERGVKGGQEVVAGTKKPRSVTIASKGIKTSHDFACVMSALMSDLLEGRLSPNIGNATCNAGGKLLKIVEMQYRYGTDGPGSGQKILKLAVQNPTLTISDGEE